MKYLLLIILTFFNLEASASCMVWAKVTGNAYNVNLWKHTDGKEDSVRTRNYKKSDLVPLNPILESHDSVKFIYNDNKFTSMRYEGGKTLRWDDLTDQEKNAVRFVNRKFNLAEQ